MPRFAYRAKTDALRTLEGTIEAESEAAALSRLGREGVFPITIAEVGVPAPSPLGLPSRIPPRALAYATHQLSDLLSGGLPLLSALALLTRQTEHAGLRRVIEALEASVRDGQALSEALGAHPGVFPPIYRSMVRAGEVGGRLELALARLAEFGEHEADLRSRVLSAAAYPAFVLCVAAAMTIFLLTYVIPKLSLVFAETGQLLPLPTRFLLGVSALVTRGWWALLAGAVVAGWGVAAWAASPRGRSRLDRMVLAIPAVGGLVRRLETGRIARTLGTLLSQGVPILQALEVVADNVGSPALQHAVLGVRDAVREGASLAAALGRARSFPDFVVNMVAVGEESGTVDAALLKVAAAYEREVDRTIRTLTTILEPLLLVAVGGVVMFIVLAMLLPVFQIGLGVQ